MPPLALLLQVALPLWVAAGATTATGRVLADAHWLSDTLAGAAVGAACVSALAITVKQLRRWQP
jgi:membrane-associated phospholipid phosphatase